MSKTIKEYAIKNMSEYDLRNVISLVKQDVDNKLNILELRENTDVYQKLKNLWWTHPSFQGSLSEFINGLIE